MVFSRLARIEARVALLLALGPSKSLSGNHL